MDLALGPERERHSRVQMGAAATAQRAERDQAAGASEEQPREPQPHRRARHSGRDRTVRTEVEKNRRQATSQQNSRAEELTKPRRPMPATLRRLRDHRRRGGAPNGLSHACGSAASQAARVKARRCLARLGGAMTTLAEVMSAAGQDGSTLPRRNHRHRPGAARTASCSTKAPPPRRDPRPRRHPRPIDQVRRNSRQ
jgi:hypothetical protein